MTAALVLPPPALGSDLLRHGRDFCVLERRFDTVRDTVNLGIDTLNDLGCGLRRLPDESLRELVVLPLTGDYRRIRQNAAAIEYVDAAMSDYASATLRLAAAVDPAWRGDAAAAYLLRLGRHAAAARGAGALISRAAPVFEEIARFSELLAVEVEDLVVELVETGTRLATRLLARAAGPAGWAVFAAEVAMRGLDAVTDLVDDVRRLLAIIDRLLDLKAELADWVAEQCDRLDRLREIADLVRAELR